MGRAPTVICAALALALFAPRAEEPAVPSPPVTPKEPAPDVLLYERDFELLIEESGVPTAGELALDRQLEEAEERRSALVRKETELKRRLDAITGSYTLVAAAEETARQGVSDLREAREHLTRQLEEVRTQLAALSREERELRERRNR